MDATSVLDALFTLLATGCLAFLVYGAWLCAAERTAARESAPRSAEPGGGDRSAIPL